MELSRTLFERRQRGLSPQKRSLATLLMRDGSCGRHLYPRNGRDRKQGFFERSEEAKHKTSVLQNYTFYSAKKVNLSRICLGVAVYSISLKNDEPYFVCVSSCFTIYRGAGMICMDGILQCVYAVLLSVFGCILFFINIAALLEIM